MESTQEDFSSFTTKGRRTKRQRSLLDASVSSSYRGGGGCSGCSENSFGSSSYATLSDEHDVMSEVTTEEEDMANCLILLAQGTRERSSVINSKLNNNNNNNISNNNIIFSTSTSNNTSIGVHECKTCNKTFPSFQALGGHRTSHKKITPPSTTTIPSFDCHDEHQDVVVDHDVMKFTSEDNILVQTHENRNKNKARVHECSICGSEFPSGQALGGHMRRHRPIAPTTTTVSPGRLMSSEAATTVVIDTGGQRNILNLDLNLPAPIDQDDNNQLIVHEDVHHMESKFVHVIPRPALLVDCRY